MALNWTSIDLPFSAGLDVKTSPLLVNAPSLLSVNNGIFTQGGTITKRNGFSGLPQMGNILTISGVATSGIRDLDGAKLTTFNNEILGISPNGSITSYATGSQSWVGKGNISPASFAQNAVIANSAQQSNPSMATLSGITLCAWDDSRGGVRYSIFDENSRVLLVSDQLLDSGGSNPCVATAGGYLIILWANSNNLKTIGISPLQPTVVVGPEAVGSDAATSNLHMDMITNPVDSTSCIFAYTSSTSNYIKLAYIYANLGVASGPVLGQVANGYVNPVLSSMAGNASVGLVSAFIRGSQAAYLLTVDSSAGVQSASVPNTLITTNVHTIDASTSCVNIGGCISGGNAAIATVCYEISAAATYNHYVNICRINATSAPTSPVNLVRSCGMASQPFTGSDGNVYILTVYQDPIQSTIFMYSAGPANVIYPALAQDGPAQGALCGNGFSGTSGGLFTGGSVPRPFFPEPFIISLPVTSRITVTTNFLQSATGAPYTYNYITGVDRLDVEWSSPVISYQAGMNTLFNGAQVSCYDGISVIESGFPVYPFIPETSFSVLASSGYMAAGSYGFQGVYFYRDQQRQAWYSAPSPSVQVSGVSAGAAVLCNFPTLRVTNKSSEAAIPRADVVLKLFRTSLTNPSVPQLVPNGNTDPVLNPTFNNVTVDTVPYLCTVNDATIAGNEILYTNPTGSGELPNLPMPPASILAVGKNRVFLAGVPTQPFTVYYSQPWVSGSPIEFSPELLMPITQNDGPITALAVLDVNVLVFKENSIYFFAGDGPDETGNNNQFTDIDLVTGDVGCVNQQSICTGPSMVFFLSNKGIYMIDRSNQVSYIGAPVERLVNPPGGNQVVINSATLITGTTQVRFTTNAGYALTYDYFFKQWSQPTPIDAVSAVNWASGGSFSPSEGINPSYIYTYLDEAGIVHYETPGQYLDGNRAITLLLKTAPLHLAGLQGYQRVAWLYFMCEYYGEHQLQIDLFYDNEQYSSNTIIVDPQSWLGGEGFGDGNFGAGPFGGVSSTTYQFRIPVSRQLCQTLQIQIQDTKQGNTASFAVNSVKIVYGTASGKNPLTRAGGLKTISNG